MRIELATPADVPALTALINSAYRGEHSRKGWTTEADYFAGERTNEKSLAERLNAPGSLMLLLRDHDQLVGCVYLELGYQGDPHQAYLGMLTISPTAQAGGLGKKLMRAAEEKARERGARRMILFVLNPRDTLMAWYERLGYRRTGETSPFPYEKAEAEKPLRKDLHFLHFKKDLG